MSRPLRALAVAVALCVPLAVVAPAGAAAGAKAKPAPWAKSVCSKIGAWRTTIEDASEQAASGAPANAKAAKKALVKLVGTSLKATKRLVKDLKKVGAPTVDDGKQISSVLVQQIRQVQATIAGALTQLKDAPTSDAATFQGAAHGVEDSLEAGLESVQQALRAATLFDAPELVAAFNAEPACTDITA